MPDRQLFPPGSGNRRFPLTEALRCHYCRQAQATTRDHVVPRKLGGRTKPFNVVPACAACNALKGDSYPTCPCNFCAHARRKQPFTGRRRTS